MRNPFKVQSDLTANKGFTLTEVLLAIVVVAILSIILLASISSIRASGKIAKASSEVRQLGLAALLYSFENDGNFPVGYPHIPDIQSGMSSYDRAGMVWFEAIGRLLYPEIRSKSSDPWMWAGRNIKGFEGTIFRSPAAEPDARSNVASYGYNELLYARAGGNRKYSHRYNPAITALIADNSGRTHSLNYGSVNAQVNARHGASAPHASDGKALVVYLDGRTAVLLAEEVLEINSDNNHPFWGTPQ
jgi:prepilin-type N-terminal cleavage/methylation domain-containing protein